MLMPLVDIHTIGAGGGSLAWLEAGGLRVGPQSAGADPGPGLLRARRHAARPSPTPTSSSAGSIPAYFLGGRMSLDDEAAADARSARSRPSVGLDDAALAEGMLAIINAKMADAMRTITVKQGIDPREYSLVAFGGAGPMHAVWLAEELDIGEVIVPVEPRDVLGVGHAPDRHAPRRRAAAFYQPLAGLERRPAAGRRSTSSSEEGGALLGRGGRGGRRHATSPAPPTCATSARSTRSTVPIGRTVDLGGDRRTRSTRRTASATGTRPRARRSSSSTCASPRWAGSRRRRAPFTPPDGRRGPVLGTRDRRSSTGGRTRRRSCCATACAPGYAGDGPARDRGGGRDDRRPARLRRCASTTSATC